MIGLVLTVISLVWTTYSTGEDFETIRSLEFTYSVFSSLPVYRIPTHVNKETGMSLSMADTVTGGAISAAAAADAEAGKPTAVSTTDVSATVPSDDQYATPGMKSLFVQVSVVFLLISGYFAMILTNWATLQTATSISNPKTGRAAMWIQAAGQWIAVVIYLWSLLAPKLFPDRDFSN